MEKPCSVSVSGQDVFCTARIKTYPDRSSTVLVCDKAIFGGKGWEDARPPKVPEDRRKEAGEGSTDRAIRRARAQVRDIALCTPFSYFVTLTLDEAMVDRYDMVPITKKLNNWLDNQVRRHGLAYVLVPERHKDGAVHFHGFFNDALTAVDSGTITMGSGKPRRPRSAAQREDWISQGGHPVYNLPAWTLGFTTAIALYGDYNQAVGYVCKYIGKDQGGAPQPQQADDQTPEPDKKIGGRWYYSGGDLGHPEVLYCNLALRDAEAMPGAYAFAVQEAGMSFVQFSLKGGDECEARKHYTPQAPDS